MKLKKLVMYLIPILWVGGTIALSQLFFRVVDLQPKVSEDFFFASNDPEFKENNKIFEYFPELSQPVIVSAKGDVHSKRYIQKVRELSKVLSRVKDVMGVQSITQGPKDVKDAFKSPLWRRLLIAGDGKSTLLILNLRNIPPEKMVEKIEKIVRFYDEEDFRLIISGPPYVIELIRRNLIDDLKVFSLAALVIFAVLILIVYRSGWILFGTLTACALSMMLTLFVTNWLQIPIGPLTANLSTIVFVITLSYITYLTFNWEHLMVHESDKRNHHVSEAVRITFHPTFWSAATTFLGFLSCVFVPAIPLRQLGIAGSIGTLIAFAMAFLVFPWFLWPAKKGAAFIETFGLAKQAIRKFFTRKHLVVTGMILLLAGVSTLGVKKLNTDPSLLAYFKKGSLLLEGLEYIDHNGGSSPLKIVIRDTQKRKFNTDDAYRKLWGLHLALEQHPAVGTLLSQPLIMAEAKMRIPFADLFSWDWKLDILEKPEYYKIVSYVLTPDRTRSLFYLRMKESERVKPRTTIVKETKEIVRRKGFEPELVGGIYLLQGRLTQLVIRSLLISLVQLIVVFGVIGLILSWSLRVTAALFASLVVIPVCVLGVIGYWRIPVDMISAPACNIAIGMGVDAMLHMLIRVKRCQKKKMNLWESWAEARIQLWKPILIAALIVCSGFAIFCFSTFPPTQRFGLAIVIGSFMSPLAALFVLPNLAGASLRRSRNDGA